MASLPILVPLSDLYVGAIIELRCGYTPGFLTVMEIRADGRLVLWSEWSGRVVAEVHQVLRFA